MGGVYARSWMLAGTSFGSATLASEPAPGTAGQLVRSHGDRRARTAIGGPPYLLCVGVARVLDLSPLIASMAVGATMVNFTRHSGPLFDTLSRTDPPFYAIFFVLAGADLDLDLVGSLGLSGVVYLVGRARAESFSERAWALAGSGWSPW